MRWLKRLGRIVTILTHEDQDLDSNVVETVWLIQLPQEVHGRQALEACRTRFPRAQVRLLAAEDEWQQLPQHPLLTVIRLPARGYWRALMKELRRQRQTSRAAVVVLSLHPFMVALACLRGRGPCLLFNRWGQWFCVRRRTWVEFLTFRRGMDRVHHGEQLAWEVLGGRAGPLGVLARVWLGRLAEALVDLIRGLSLVGYLVWRLAVLFWRRWRFQLQLRGNPDPLMTSLFDLQMIPQQRENPQQGLIRLVACLRSFCVSAVSRGGVASAPLPDTTLERYLHKMRRAWDARAKVNARYYVNTAKTQWSDAEFFASGEQAVAEQILSDMVHICQRKDPQQMRVLEIGCGAGRMTQALGKLFGDVYAVDISGEMVKCARAASADCPTIHIYQNNGKDLSLFPDNFFDFATSFLVFQHIARREIIEHYVREVYRVLRPGALFKFQVQGGPGPTPSPDDTWSGLSFSEEDAVHMARWCGFEPRYREGTGTQYFWLWYFKG